MYERFLIFAGSDYYPNGGWDDYIGDATTLEEALAKALEEVKREFYDWYQVVDMKTGEIVAFNKAWYLEKP